MAPLALNVIIGRTAPRSRQRGFSLLELITIVAITAFLIALLAPVFSSVREQAQSARCVSQLGGISPILNAYAADHNMQISFMRDGPTSRMWYEELSQHAQLTEQAAQKAFGCPSLPWGEVTSWVCYGFRANYIPPKNLDPGKVVRPNGAGTTSYYEFSYANVSEPGKFFVMADTGTPTGRQTFRIVPPGLYSGGGISLRHKNRANVLFLDGHVEPLDAKEFALMGITTVLNKNGESLSTTSPLDD